MLHHNPKLSQRFQDLTKIKSTNDTLKVGKNFLYPKQTIEMNYSLNKIYVIPQVKDGDSLPPIICHRCVYKLDVLHNFREVSHKSDVILKQYLDYAKQLSSYDDQVISIEQILLILPPSMYVLFFNFLLRYYFTATSNT